VIEANRWWRRQVKENRSVSHIITVFVIGGYVVSSVSAMVTVTVT